MSYLNTMKNLLTQETCPKNLYLSALYALLQRQAPENGMTDEPMIGTLYYCEDEEKEEEGEGTYVYANIGLAQYLGGEEFPENDDVRLHFTRTDVAGNVSGFKDEPFVLSFHLHTDAQHYFDRVDAYREAQA